MLQNEAVLWSGHGFWPGTFLHYAVSGALKRLARLSRLLFMLPRMCARFVILYAHMIGACARGGHSVLGEGADVRW